MTLGNKPVTSHTPAWNFDMGTAPAGRKLLALNPGHVACFALITLIVPRHAIDKIKKNALFSTVEINDEGGKWGVVDGFTRTGFEPINAAYPNYRRIIPAKPSGEAAQFDANLITPFAKAAKALGAIYDKVPRVLIKHNGNGAALVSFGRDDEYIGVIMPLRPLPQLTPPCAPPVWAIEQLEAHEELV